MKVLKDFLYTKLTKKSSSKTTKYLYFLVIFKIDLSFNNLTKKYILNFRISFSQPSIAIINFVK